MNGTKLDAETADSSCQHSAVSSQPVKTLAVLADG